VKFDNIVLNIVNDFGCEVILDSKRFLAILLDYAPSFKKEIKLIELALGLNINKRIYEAKNKSTIEKNNELAAIKNKIENELGMKSDIADFITGVFEIFMKLEDISFSDETDEPVTSNTNDELFNGFDYNEKEIKELIGELLVHCENHAKQGASKTFFIEGIKELLDADLSVENLTRVCGQPEDFSKLDLLNDLNRLDVDMKKLELEMQLEALECCLEDSSMITYDKFKAKKILSFCSALSSKLKKND